MIVKVITIACLSGVENYPYAKIGLDFALPDILT